MKVKFNLFERVAGIFVLGAILGSIGLSIGIAIKKGWFEPMVEFKTVVSDAEGIRVGTPVKIAGLHAGEVDEVMFSDSEEIIVHFMVYKKFQSKIREDSMVQIKRPFVIGEKTLEITVGSKDFNLQPPGRYLVSQQSLDLMTFFASDSLSKHLSSMSKIMESLHTLAEAMFSEDRTNQMVKLFDKLMPLVDDLQSMSKNVALLSGDLNEKKILKSSLKDIKKLTWHMNKALPEFTKHAPSLSKNMTIMVANLAKLTDDMSDLIPIIMEIAPKIPGTTDKAINALDETVVTLRALQKTWMLRGAVEDVMEEDQKRKRRPASK